MNQNQNRNKNFKNGGWLSIILWAVFLTMILNYVFAMHNAVERATSVEITYTEFIALLDDPEHVDSISLNKEKSVIYIYGKDPDTGASMIWYTALLPEDEELIPLLKDSGIPFKGEIPVELSPVLSFFVSWLLPMVVMLLLLMLLFRFMGNRAGGMGGLGGVGKANAKVYMEKTTGVTFADVAGQDEAKESLIEIIDFLHNPQKYTAIGAKLPKGALLVGSPGTGKTLLAKAVAGEAKVPFFSISGSDFVEMFVGVGASRVRDLFKEAAKVAPCIIFIDEIDTIGKTRDNGKFGSGNDEREQTLNQLLAELDGFDPSKGVIVLGATNRPEVLDKALLRPGRFDRRITVDRPNLAGRLATLQVHTRNIRLAEDVDLNRIAQATAGAVGADLANLVNEAALRAVRLGRQAVNQDDLLVSFEVVIAGTEKKGTVLTEQEKKIIAYHEVGHALVAAKQKNTQPVQKITIVPHTHGALGYTMQMPEEEKFLMSRDEIIAEIRTLVAGRAAEQTVFQVQTSGAANDIERATDMARKLVTMYGMSDKVGLVALATIQSQYLDGGLGLNCAQETAAMVDQEVMSIIAACYQDACQMLKDNRDMLDKIASYLLERETITGQEMMAILEGRDPATVEDRAPERINPLVSPVYTPGAPLTVPGQPFPMPDPADGAAWSDSTWSGSAAGSRAAAPDMPGDSGTLDASDIPDVSDTSDVTDTPEPSDPAPHADPDTTDPSGEPGAPEEEA